MESALALTILGTLGWKLVDFSKFLTNKQWNAAVTQLYAWLVGIVLVVLTSAADVFEGFALPGMTVPVGDMDFGSLLVVGMSMSSLMGVGFDFKKAIDGSDSAVVPPLTTVQDKRTT